MRIIATKTLQIYWQQPEYGRAERQLKAWIREVEDANWSTPADVKAAYGSASIISQDRVIFNICGNKYRLIVAVKYEMKLVFVRFFGTHQEYQEVDASTV